MRSSSHRHRKRPTTTTSVPSCAPPPQSSATESSGLMGRLGGRRRVVPLSSALLVFCLALVAYITWKEVSSVAPGLPFSEDASEGDGSLRGKASGQGTIPVYSIEVVKEYPHDPRAFTQGLIYAENDVLFESTGLYGQSSVREVLLHSGKVKAIYHMDSSFFGEGLTLFGERLLQVTWLTRTGFIYDRYNLTEIQKFTHDMRDGWGLATDGKVIFGSDGTSSLYQLDTHSFKAIKISNVRFDGYGVKYLNELEYINGEVWANVWQSDCIARISVEDGEVHGWILLHKLRQQLIESGNQEVDVLNGIAWDKARNRIFVTGKLWPKLYEIKLHELRSRPSNGTIKDLCQLILH